MLHAAPLFWPRAAGDVPPRASAPLQARLLAPRPTEAKEAVAVEPLLKDTLTERPLTRPAPTRDALQSSRPSPVQRAQASERAQRKLHEHLFYPQAAIDLGLEGKVMLRLELDAAGEVIDAAVLAGSGHSILDSAALRAARQIGRIEAAGARELLLPVVFRLD
ncbi:energy transducer TonB [Methyloversatilis sp.]|uniref:energy transducer TonB n=1 Tax=Methyloversatilis sp. TaxID=2569862 RepID=UPI0035B1E5F5